MPSTRAKAGKAAPRVLKTTKDPRRATNGRLAINANTTETSIYMNGARNNKRRMVTRASTKQLEASKRNSRLEQLPVEILQEIFFLSRNLRLPLASPLLYSSLTSDHIKKRFICAAFVQEEVTNDALEFGMSGSSIESARDHLEFSRFQGELMGLRWFTIDILKQCQREFLWRQVKKAVEYFNSMYPESMLDRAKIFSDVEQLFNNATSVGILMLSAGERQKVEYYPKPDAKKPSLTFMLDHEDDFHFGYPSRLLVKVHHEDNRKQKFHTCCQDYHPVFDGVVNLCMPQVSDMLELPNRLVRGPWTEEKVRLLKWICDAWQICEYDDLGNELRCDSGVASQGLEDAIREYCAPAMALLAKPASYRWYMDFYSATGLDEIDRLAAPLQLGKMNSNFGVETDTHLLSNDAPAYIHVSIEDKHLIAALEAAEQMKDRDAKVFRWLLPLAVMQGFDRDHPPTDPAEIFKVQRWAFKKEEQDEKKGIKNGLGTLALRLLEEEERNVKDLFRDFVVECL